MNIVEPTYNWNGPLTDRAETLYVVWHHTACEDQMQTPAAINAEHKAIGDIGIAYNRGIMQNGETFQGRPDAAISAAAHGVNQTSIDIVVEGNFMVQYLTAAAEEAIKANYANLTEKYPGAKHISHGYVHIVSGNPGDATACCGTNLMAFLKELIPGFEA